MAVVAKSLIKVRDVNIRGVLERGGGGAEEIVVKQESAVLRVSEQFYYDRLTTMKKYMYLRYFVVYISSSIPEQIQTASTSVLSNRSAGETRAGAGTKGH